MGDDTDEQTVWSLQGNLAELSAANLSGHIDATRPNLGINEAALGDLRGPNTLLGVHRLDRGHATGWPLSLAEAFVRGNDLVTTYQPTGDWPFSPQLYWQANSLQSVAGVLASMSLLVSVQTHLLETCPQIGVTTKLSRGELLSVSIGDNARHAIEPVKHTRSISAADSACCIVSRFEGSSLSYVQIVPPGDYREIILRPDARDVSLEWHLFADFLEKGVIRRARIHSALLPRENDIDLAVECCKAAERFELPLTA